MTYQKDVWRYVKDRADIESVARTLFGAPHHADYKGSWYSCPFHREDTASFVVTKNKRIAHCFGACGKTWDVFSMYAEAKNVTSVAAMEEVASMCGIDKSSFIEANPRADNAFRQYVRVNEYVANRFYNSLTKKYNGELPIDYWFKRGLSTQTIKEMQLGIAPVSTNSGSFLQNLRESFPQYPIESFGLIDTYTGGCKFAGRFMFPIQDYMGNIVGFSGRAIDPTVKSKYLNTSANNWFGKGALLYNFNRAKKYHSVILVEGYMDALSLIEAGLPNVAALMGTVLTSDHLGLLEGKDIVLCLDNDSAGVKGVLRAISEHNYIPFRVVSTPAPYKDVNDFLLAEGKEATLKHYGRSIHRMDYVFDYYKNFVDLTELSGRDTLAREVLRILDYASLVEQDYYTKHLCRLLGVEGRFKHLKEMVEGGEVL